MEWNLLCNCTPYISDENSSEKEFENYREMCCLPIKLGWKCGNDLWSSIGYWITGFSYSSKYCASSVLTHWYFLCSGM